MGRCHCLPGAILLLLALVLSVLVRLCCVPRSITLRLTFFVSCTRRRFRFLTSANLTLSGSLSRAIPPMQTTTMRARPGCVLSCAFCPRGIGAEHDSVDPCSLVSGVTATKLQRAANGFASTLVGNFRKRSAISSSDYRTSSGQAYSFSIGGVTIGSSWTRGLVIHPVGSCVRPAD